MNCIIQGTSAHLDEGIVALAAASAHLQGAYDRDA